MPWQSQSLLYWNTLYENNPVGWDVWIVSRLNPYYTGTHSTRTQQMQQKSNRVHVLILIILEHTLRVRSSSYAAYLNASLNPYYTGTHSTRAWGCTRRYILRSLNPYYTGTHSTRCCGYAWRRVLLRLNPYYTGTHSTSKSYIVAKSFTKSVLILIILEHTLRDFGNNRISSYAGS